MTVEELFDNKIMWFDQPLSLDAFERFGELLVLFLESKGIDTEEVKETIERLSQELYDDYGEDACVYYLRFYKVNYRERSYYSLNGYLGSLRGEELENAKLAHGYTITPIEIFFQIPLKDSDKFFISENYSNDRGEFYSEFFDIIYPLVKDEPFYCFLDKNHETPYPIDRNSDVVNDGVSDLYYVGELENGYYNVYWYNKRGGIEFADDYTKESLGGHFYRGEYNLREWYRKGFTAKSLGGELHF